MRRRVVVTGMGIISPLGIGVEEKVSEFVNLNDDYREILIKALSDRLAEAFAERMHERVRKEFWGYQAAENLSNDQLIGEKYVGIRPAPGYPACPDHSLKPQLLELLDASELASIELTESFAMIPSSSVTGYYFSHTLSQYFGTLVIITSALFWNIPSFFICNLFFQ